MKEKFQILNTKSKKEENLKVVHTEKGEIIGKILEYFGELNGERLYTKYIPFWHNTLYNQDEYYKLGELCENWDEAIERIIGKYQYGSV